MLRAILGTFARQAIVGLTQLGLITMISQRFGPEGVGTYFLAVLVPTLGSQMLTFGIQSASIYMGARRIHSIGTILYGNLLATVLISAVFVTVALPVAMFWGEVLMAGVSFELLALGIASFPASFVVNTFPALAQAQQAFRIYNLFLLLLPLTQFTLTGAILLAGGGILSVVAGFAVSSWISALIIMTFMLKKWRIETSGGARFLRESFSYGMQSHLGNIVTLLNYRAVIWILAQMLGLSASGLYILAMQPAEKLWLPSQAVATISFPFLSRLHTETGEKATDATKLAEQLARVTLTVTLMLALMAAFVAGPVFPILFGPRAQSAVIPFLLLLPGITAWAPSRILASDIGARGAVRFNFLNALATFSLNLLFLFPLISAFGVEGAAVATSLAYTGDLIIRSLFHARAAGTRPFAWIAPKVGDLYVLRKLLRRGRV